MTLKNKTPKDLIGMFFEGLMVLLVVIFLGINSYRFWAWIFPPEQWYLAPLGFSMTGGAAIVYLMIFAWRANTSLKKTIALGMILFCMIGELLTVGFGFQIEAWTRTGYIPGKQDLDFMKGVIQILGLSHSLAILVYYLGDRIAEMFGDQDKDGVPNYRDPDYKPQQNNSSNNNHQYPTWDLSGLLLALRISRQQAENLASRGDVNQFYNALKSYGIEKIDISKKNFKALYHQLKQGQGQVNP